MMDNSEPNIGDIILINEHHIFEVREWKLNQESGYVHARVRPLPNTTTPEPRIMDSMFPNTAWRYLLWEEGGNRKELTKREGLS